MIWAQVHDFDGPPIEELPFNPYLAIFSFGSLLFWAVAMAFWLWMIIDCYQKDPDRNFWIWILLIAPFGSVIYFFVRWLLNHQLRMPGPLKRLNYRSKLAKLERAALQIGNPHQYVQWGDALKDAGMPEKSDAAYSKALENEPNNIQALWGLAQTLISRSNFAAAQPLLIQVLEIDPQYKFGDVSLELARCLMELGEKDAARTKLDEHVRRWRHPESVYMLALLEADRGETEVAQDHLRALILDVDGSPKGIARRHRIWRSKAKKMLKQIG